MGDQVSALAGGNDPGCHQIFNSFNQFRDISRGEKGYFGHESIPWPGQAVLDWVLREEVRGIGKPCNVGVPVSIYGYTPSFITVTSAQVGGKE